ncbi:MAG TPA: ABC transporter ATP-binding protein [Solirubrobacterales bacterium]|nr:ABC transporter ATP-binding protein [Solirubrobacterales bacterium]
MRNGNGHSSRRADLRAEGLTLGYGNGDVVRGVDLEIFPGRVTAIVGANASGKSTLLRGLARLLAPRHGAVYLDGKEIHRHSTREVARVLGLLTQSPSPPDGITVADLVARGRYPHQGWVRQNDSADRAAVARALEATQTAVLASRRVDELSGGQRQRVWVAMALAQETDLLLLDEPTTFLDLSHQVELLDLFAELNRAGKTIVLVLHDLNLACRYADRIVAMKDGRVYAEGNPEHVITADAVAEVFGLSCEVIDDPVTGGPLIVPVGRRRRPAPVAAVPS